MTRPLLSAALVALLASTGMAALAQPSGGGVLTVATVGEPPTLDEMQVPTDIVLTIGQHIFETLYTFDADWQSRPLLAAAMPEISADDLSYRIPLRQGVIFHDGSPLGPQDVVASLKRWMAINSKGKQVAEIVSGVEADGDGAVIIKLKSRYSPLIATLSQASIIMPAGKLARGLSHPWW